MRFFFAVGLGLASVAGVLSPASAAPPPPPALAPEQVEDGVIGATEPTLAPAKATSDTVWIADWTFDAPGGGCDDSGWTKVDERIGNDGSNDWSVEDAYAGTGHIVGRAAVLRRHDLCWTRDGYGNDWDYSVVLQYRGSGSKLSFDFAADSEPGYDFVTVEADSAGASEARVDYWLNPRGFAAAHRLDLATFDGFLPSGRVTNLALPDFGAPATTHEVYIRFSSDAGYSDEDGLYPTALGAGLVLDHIVVTGGLAYGEDFEDGLDSHVALVNSADATPYAQWGRLYEHITDNDKCTENTSCAWLWSDPDRLAARPDMAFGPGQAVLNAWIDESILSPWVNLAGVPRGTGTVLAFRRFGGSDFSSGSIVQNWSLRYRTKRDNTDTSAPGDSVICTSWWQHAVNFNSLTSFVWRSNLVEITPYLPASANEIQVRFRVARWCDWIAGCGGPYVGNPGPGPFLDRIRLGRRVLSGPVLDLGIDTRSQAQDCFPTRLGPSTPGEHYLPDGSNRFGACAFSAGADLVGSPPLSPNLIVGDSISIGVTDARGAGGITSVAFHGAIVAGPHAGRAPAPYLPGPNGFFVVPADSARTSDGRPAPGKWCIDLDDTYFRGGDVLVYFWYATDAAGGATSYPPGITSAEFPPASVAAAEVATDGLLEVSFLPAVDWDPAYLARVRADSEGDLEPTPAELANSRQRNCILYYQHVLSNRRSGPTRRTAFMYTLDRLGYAGKYDVYDVQGYGSTNNQLGGRATVEQCSGYALVVEDDGRSNLDPCIPDGSEFDASKINQAQWYRDYLAQGVTGLAGRAALWILGESTAYRHRTNPLFSVDLGLAGVADDQGLAVNPEVAGAGSFTWWDGRSTSFAADGFALNGGCPVYRNYDAFAAGGTAAVTHRYGAGAATGSGAVLLNANAALRWNTILMGFAWGDIRDPAGGAPEPVPPELRLAGAILDAIVPFECRVPPGQTGVEPPEPAGAPRATALHQNVPNPFNPVTTITFDLAAAGHVRLAVYAVTGREVRRLVDGPRPAGWRQQAAWDGLDASGRRAPSGVYLYKLESADGIATRKLVLAK